MNLQHYIDSLITLVKKPSRYQRVNSTSYDSLDLPIVWVLVIGIAIDAYIEFFVEQSSFFFYKDLLKLVLIFLMITGHYFFSIKSKTVAIFTFYLVLFSSMISVPLHLAIDQSLFETLYLEAQLVILILTFGIGVLARPVHMLVFIFSNIIFTVGSYNISEGTYPVENLFFYLTICSATGFTSYKIYSIHLDLHKKISEDNSEIILKNIQLKELNNSKLELMRILGHDLRTPFSQIQSLAELLPKSADKEDNTTRDYLLEATSNGMRLLDDILTNAKIQNVKIDLLLKPIFIKDILLISKTFHNPTLEEKSITIEDRTNPDLILNVDSVLFETLVRNILSNAIKFSSKGSKIEISNKIEGDFICIHFTDHGAGMSKQKINEIMTGTADYSNNEIYSETGLGIGLQICKSITEHHGGKFIITSVLNEGTNIELCMPAPDKEAIIDSI